MRTTVTTEKCGQCGDEFATLEDVFAHECRDSKDYGRVDGEPAPVALPDGHGYTSNQYGRFENHAPSEKQVAFIKRLCAERGLDVDPIWIRTKSRCSAEIDRLMKIPATVTPADAPKASEKQVAFITSLMLERGLEPSPGLALLTKSDASDLITTLKATPKVQNDRRADGSKVTRIDQDGFYYLPETKAIYKVQRAVHGSGNLYAKRLEVETGEWIYEGRKPLSLALEPLTLEIAKELGHLYGRCMCCGATLTNETSIEAGIGPVCASRLR